MHKYGLHTRMNSGCRLWWSTRFSGDVVAYDVVFIIAIANAVHRKWRTDTVHAVTTHKRAAFSRTMVMTQMATKILGRSERSSAVGRPAEDTSLPWHDISSGWLGVQYRMVISNITSARCRISSQRQLRRIWVHSFIFGHTKTENNIN